MYCSSGALLFRVFTIEGTKEKKRTEKKKKKKRKEKKRKEKKRKECADFLIHLIVFVVVVFREEEGKEDNAGSAAYIPAPHGAEIHQDRC